MNNNLFHFLLFFLLQMKRHSTSSSSERPSKGAKLNECKVFNLVHYQSIFTVKARIQDGTSLLLNTLTKEDVAFFPLCLYIPFRQNQSKLMLKLFGDW
jgi:hypothetical protein